jgi:primosomal protein N' (replication factor Y)
MDTDSTRHAGSHEAILEQFRRGEARILLGTQMIAKGLDFPNVTLVGVINADTALHLPDFRAGERTFQLLSQVAGRSGRGDAGGRVVVQTFSPEHAIIQAASRHDYLAFAGPELALRAALGYPPCASLARIVVRSRVSEQAAAFASTIAERLRTAIGRERETCSADQVESARQGESGPRQETSIHTVRETGGDSDAIRIMGPVPAPLARLRGMFRYHLFVHAPDDAALYAAIPATDLPNAPEGVEYSVDIDPQDML